MFGNKNKAKTKVGSRSVKSKFTRDPGTRQTFLRHNRGLFGSGIYCCAYCGKLMKRRSMEVDHCIPVDAAQKSSFARSYIRFMGLFMSKADRDKGVNGYWNLVPACEDCNGTKTNKTGLWVPRGIIGRYLFPTLWYSASAVAVVSLGQYLITGQGMWAYVAKGISALGSGLTALAGIV